MDLHLTIVRPPYENLQPDMARIGPDSDHKVIFAA